MTLITCTLFIHSGNGLVLQFQISLSRFHGTAILIEYIERKQSGLIEKEIE